MHPDENTWRFVVDDGVEPAPDCLERLEAARALVPGAVLVAARVVLPDGSLDPASEPMPRTLDKQEAVDAAALRLLAVRAVRPGAMLVRGGASLDLAGSAALLASGHGYLAPEAVAVRRTPKRPEPVHARLRMLRAPHWTREERLMQLFALLNRG